jgi:ribosomal protein S18 acetylase RimI-like enzyme
LILKISSLAARDNISNETKMQTMLVKLEIRKLEAKDINELYRISQRTFYDTFASENTAEDMELCLNTYFNIEKLRNELNNSNSEFYFVTLNGVVAAYLKVNFGQAQTEIRDEMALEIERIYVLIEYQGNKIGQFLLNYAIDMAKYKQYHYIWLGVWEKNYRAIQFYQKNGFVKFDRHIFTLGTDEQIDNLMKLNLN